MEKIIAYHCAPALAGIKPSNLVSIFKNRVSDIHSELDKLNKQLNCKDIYIEAIHECSSRVLSIVYRKKVLERHLKSPDCADFLHAFGYPTQGTTEEYIDHLKERLSNSVEFPHEIGIFLGYPIHDIYGFIHHKDEGCLLCGEWRVYENAEKAQKLFLRYRACRKAVSKRMASGCTLAEIFCAA